MNHDPRDCLAVTQPDVTPGLPGVSGLVDAVPLQHVSLNLRLTHADVDHVGIRFRDCDCANGRTLDLAVGDRPPSRSSISGLPQAASNGAGVVFESPAAASCDSQGTPAAVRPDVAPSKRAEQAPVIGAAGRGDLAVQRQRGQSDEEQKKATSFHKTSVTSAEERWPFPRRRPDHLGGASTRGGHASRLARGRLPMCASCATRPRSLSRIPRGIRAQPAEEPRRDLSTCRTSLSASSRPGYRSSRDWSC